MECISTVGRNTLYILDNILEEKLFDKYESNDLRKAVKKYLNSQFLSFLYTELKVKGIGQVLF